MRAMVLSDGETYSGLAGCKIVLMPDDVMKQLEAGDAHERDFDEHGTTLCTFQGDEGAHVALDAKEREYLTWAMDTLEEQLRLDGSNPDWDGEKWGPTHEATSGSITAKLRALALTEHAESA
jgi:hypothetical protein